ncbi:hypothetical protein GLAREA_06010 [Glarea lozoyensis ATCC 20868]|uniref:Velvet domain-containing protein n=1 Tax=Glarea lozoyensis (strain ATCC 20868 / MF5171) TaxID=1116229 RepID=S3E3I2_GLAL2|nr:uncharacterized protein GLAREA_06010 [Glarea lozoyensis ATCC 20868]EPE32998.1 hypothetical protein GLAREA_06010 [Glarea lozoyensis ATCC 20868]
MLGLAIQPPSRVRPGVAVPMAARLASDVDIFSELAHIWAVVTLIHKDSGETLYDQLGGRVADSAHPLPDNGRGSGPTGKDRAYFYFPDLVIHDTGRYRIRVTLMQMDYSCDSSPNGIVIAREYVDSHSIVVEEGASSRSSRPSAHERAFLRILRDDGQPTPSF